MNRADNITPLHRGVRPIPLRDIHAIFGTPAEAEQIDADEQFRRAIHAEISDGLTYIVWGVVAALYFVAFIVWLSL